ncbi:MULTISPECIES: DUF1281 family ferredoxin-like fold protein [Bacteroidota]|jgi:hypothetical protein|uniref:YubB ferredoxin-like domain-containing protein n=5 Tax=Bacteroidota TaxID=976 RepID=A0A1W1YJ89_9FLAO|nr:MULTISPECIES: hypothetical protein [Bacteroidota]MBU7571218.1 hypothetical protein [Flavobacterium sp.]PZO34816.1 MAG: hypothetical protein DCE86_00610 [Flavobacteriaceae bacterium]EHM7982862.1 hypothetical protein [Elizabethkingia anophelis]EHM8030131.1 hypothetical protein [Elizabethkingia anophelis]EHZ9532885.1 hypothetical protein [Elizabethkingia anophelis]
MANWCSNTVVFEGTPEAITAIQELFQSMKEKEEKTEEGQLPEFMEDTNGGYFFNIYWNEGDEGQFQYETKWSPNIEIIQKIAEYYQVDFVQDYEEMGNLVYGRATYRDGILSDIFLGDDDFEAYEQDEETDLYHFEGEEYESDYEILETLLERKIVTL